MRQILENLMVFHGEVGEMEDLFKGDELNSNLLSFYIYMYIHQVSISLSRFFQLSLSLPLFLSHSFSLPFFISSPFLSLPIFFFYHLYIYPLSIFLSIYLDISLSKYISRHLPEVPGPGSRAQRWADRGDDVRTEEGEGEPGHREVTHTNQDTALPPDTHTGIEK